MKTRRWYLPASLLIILVLAFVFRWHIEATQSISDGRLHWVRDRWTGRLWLRAYAVSKGDPFSGSVPVPTGGETLDGIRAAERVRRDDLTLCWTVAVILTSLWLFRVRGLLHMPSGWRQRIRRWADTPLEGKPNPPNAIPLPPSLLKQQERR